MGGVFTNSGYVESSGSGTINALNGAVTISCPATSTAMLVVSGTWVATLAFEASVDSITYFSIQAQTVPGNAGVTSTVANGQFGLSVGGFQSVRIRASAYTSGTATVTYNTDSNANTSISPDVINGGTDGTPIGNTSDRLKVDTTLSSITGAVTASFSSKTRVELVTTPVNLSTGSFTNYYSYSGSGYIIGFSSEFNNAAIIPRFTVDGENIFTGNSLTTLGGFQATSNTTDRRMNGQGIVINGANIDVSFRQPVRFASTISLSADANGGVLLTRQLTQALIYIIKET